MAAIALTQIFVFAGWFDPKTNFYLTPDFGWLGAIAGGLCFGFGMALIGTCGYGALVRLGSGSLKSLIAVLVLGLTALSTQRGLLAFGRTGINDNAQISFTNAGDQSIPSILSDLVGADISALTAIIIVLAMLIWIFKDQTYRNNRKAMATGTIVGLVIAAGWIITTRIAALSFDPVQIESASFVAPVPDTTLQFGIVAGSGPDYGIGMVVGVVLGSAIAARIVDDVRWEACDDARELRRHILGAAMMGFGGVLALGCRSTRH